MTMNDLYALLYLWADTSVKWNAEGKWVGYTEVQEEVGRVWVKAEGNKILVRLRTHRSQLIQQAADRS